MTADGNKEGGPRDPGTPQPEVTTGASHALRIGHACATRPSEWPPDAHLVLAMRRPRWRARPVLDAGGVSMPAAGPSDALLNAYLGKAPRGGGLDALELTRMSWEEFAAAYRDEMRAPEGLRVLDDILGIAMQDPTRPLVVMCWERLDGPGAHAHCHRTVLVELLLERARERGIPATV